MIIAPAVERCLPAELPLELRWDHPRDPLPVRRVRFPRRSKARPVGLDAPPWLVTGPLNQPFDFSGHIRRLCESVVANCPELGHIDVLKLLFGMTQARTGRAHGLQARVTPLRFPAGDLLRKRRGVVYQVQRYFVDGQEMLYLVTFCLPRFLDQSFDEKFITLFHELYHIGTNFDGDLRRHHGRYDLHSHSKREYDKHMGHLAREYLSKGVDQSLHSFLRLDFAQLQHRHGGVTSIVVPRPKIIPLATLPSAAQMRGEP